jgi:hypothetical protein
MNGNKRTFQRDHKNPNRKSTGRFWDQDAPEGVKLPDGKEYYFVHVCDRKEMRRVDIPDYLAVTNRSAVFLYEFQELLQSSLYGFRRIFFRNVDANVIENPISGTKLKPGDTIAIPWNTPPEVGSHLADTGKGIVKKPTMVYVGRTPDERSVDP